MAGAAGFDLEKELETVFDKERELAGMTANDKPFEAGRQQILPPDAGGKDDKAIDKKERVAIINKVKVDRGLTGKTAYFDAQRIAMQEGLLPSKGKVVVKEKKVVVKKEKVPKAKAEPKKPKQKPEQNPEENPEQKAEPAKKRARGGGRKSEPLPEWLTPDMTELKEEHLSEGIRVEYRLAKRAERETATEADLDILKVLRVHLNTAVHKEGGARAAARAAKQQADQTERHLKAALTSNQRTIQLAALASVEPVES